MRRKIYVASSWRNLLQPAIVSVMRQAGHEVYDFKNPAPGNNGFSWREIHPDWENWTPQQYRDALEHPIAKAGYECDMAALRGCDDCVLVLPSGRSASWEFGWAVGNGKRGAVVMLEKCEPELMYLGNPILTTMDEVMDWAGIPAAVASSDEPVERERLYCVEYTDEQSGMVRYDSHVVTAKSPDEAKEKVTGGMPGMYATSVIEV